MLLVDTSVWVDHLRRGNPALRAALDGAEVLCHPMVIGELACGDLKRRSEVLGLLQRLPRAVAAADNEVLSFLEVRRLHGRGLGWIDAHLLASALITGCAFWTLDRRLRRAADSLSIAAD